MFLPFSNKTWLWAISLGTIGGAFGYLVRWVVRRQIRRSKRPVRLVELVKDKR